MNPQSKEMIGRVVLDRYRIVRQLAKGGMGEIFLARNEGAAGFVRPVVIKQIHPSWLGAAPIIEMFAREARIMAKLRHPGIVSVLDFAQQDGAYVMVLEYVHGHDLSNWIIYYYRRTGRWFPIGSAVVIVLRVLEALSYAHNATGMDGAPLDVVHRDIKPSNILVSTEGHVKLADFGIARAGTEQTTVAGSSAQKIKGTYPFIAPEIFEGAEPAPSTDVYACAVVLYVLLAGRNPFAAKSPRQTIRLVLDHDPQPIDAIREDVFPGLASALAKALAKDRHARYPDAASYSIAVAQLGRAEVA